MASVGYKYRMFTRSLGTATLSAVVALGAALNIPRFVTTKRVHAAVRPQKQMWEYKSVIKVLSYRQEPLSDSEVRGAKCFDGPAQVDCAKMLDSFGSDGWELVTVLSESLVGGNKDWAGATTSETFYFKRPRG
jgi:hypothetical protein